jgi:membrane protease YdiL (CAAX protease family)/uncharacterized RDD family membrane protein YckC
MGVRLGALALDWLFIVVAAFAGLLVGGSIAAATGGVQNADTAVPSAGTLLGAAIAVLSVAALPFVYMGVGWRSGATPAMRILHLRVVSAGSGEALSWAQAVLRCAGYWWSLVTVGCGFLAALPDTRRRGLADRMAGSLVLSVRTVPLLWVAAPQGWTLQPSRPPRPLPFDAAARPEAEAPVARSRWTWTDVLPVLVLFFPLAYGASWVVVFVARRLHVSGAGVPLVSLLENVAAYGASLLLIGLLVRWRRHTRLSSLGLRLPRWPWLVAGLPLGFAAFVLEDTGGIVSRIIFPTALSNNQAIGIQGEFGASLALALLSVAVVAPVSEEIMMRGFLFRYLQGRLPLWTSVLASAVIFSAFHAGWQEPTLFLPIFAVGVLLAYVYAKSGSIWPGVIVHMSLNIVGVLTIYH